MVNPIGVIDSNPVVSAERPLHALDARDVGRILETSSHGLTSAEAAARRAIHGPNQLEEEPRTSWLAVLVRQFRSPLIFILLVTVAITILLGEYLDSAVIGVVLAFNAAIGFTQERKAERAVRAALGVADDRDAAVLAWTLPADVARLLNDELDTSFVGRNTDEIDLRVHVERSRQLRAVACHHSQLADNPIPMRRLALTGNFEYLRYLRRPNVRPAPAREP